MTPNPRAPRIHHELTDLTIVMTPAVTMRKCEQKDIYAIFEDKWIVKTCLDAIDRMAIGAFRGVVEGEAAGTHLSLRSVQLDRSTQYDDERLGPRPG